MKVRVRFAPSPTGYLHVGGARTALFNWLFARKEKGSFILRIEDTDVQRSSEDMVKGILEGMEWLGLNWDEGPYFQSSRLSLYKEKAEELVKAGKAYYCYCLPEEIEERRKKIESEGKVWTYDRRCLHLSENERKALSSRGRKAIRFIVPPGKTTFRDVIHGELEFENINIEDFVLLKSDGYPTYHLSVVVDDIDMGITHVIRGDDHLSNTPKQIMLYNAFNHDIPVFAHLPLILGPDRKKLSKRHGHTSVIHFREMGYHPLAMFNFLARLSWSPGEDKDIFKIEEMIERFSLESISHNNPIFDLNKLEWLNSKILSTFPPSLLFDDFKEILKKRSIWSENFSREWIEDVIFLFKERAKTINQLVEDSLPFFVENFEYEKEAVEKYLSEEKLSEYLKKLLERLSFLDSFKKENVEQTFRSLAEEEGIKASILIHAARVALTGKRVTPGVFEMMEVLGKEKCIKRLEKLISFLEERKNENRN
jgi:glutamyl-tRNA synthetase/nondiscriminating glutamyl-tRNA synthetase